MSELLEETIASEITEIIKLQKRALSLAFIINDNHASFVKKELQSLLDSLSEPFEKLCWFKAAELFGDKVSDNLEGGPLTGIQYAFKAMDLSHAQDEIYCTDQDELKMEQAVLDNIRTIIALADSYRIPESEIQWTLSTHNL